MNAEELTKAVSERIEAVDALAKSIDELTLDMSVPVRVDSLLLMARNDLRGMRRLFERATEAIPEPETGALRFFSIAHEWRDKPCWEGQARSLKDAVERAVIDGARLDGASLVGASLVGARLVGASLDGARLDGARLDGARLDGASLDGASLDGASLDGASLDGASLDGARLDGASLDGASLDGIKADLFRVLDRAPTEVPGLLVALKEGRVDGTQYEGACACLKGTLANVAHADVDDFVKKVGLAKNVTEPSEAWFLGIKEGDTPATNQVSRISTAWVEEWLAKRAQETAVSP